MRNSGMFGIVSTSHPKLFWSGCDNDYKCHHGSHVTNAASSELGDLHRQAVPQRFFPVDWGQDETDVGRVRARWYFRLPAILMNRATITRAEHLQSIFLPRRRYKCFLCYEDQFTSYSMLCKVLLLTVNDSEKSHEVLFNGGSSCPYFCLLYYNNNCLFVCLSVWPSYSAVASCYAMTVFHLPPACGLFFVCGIARSFMFNRSNPLWPYLSIVYRKECN